MAAPTRDPHTTRAPNTTLPSPRPQRDARPGLAAGLERAGLCPLAAAAPCHRQRARRACFTFTAARQATLCRSILDEPPWAAVPNGLITLASQRHRRPGWPPMRFSISNCVSILQPCTALVASAVLPPPVRNTPLASHRPHPPFFASVGGLSIHAAPVPRARAREPVSIAAGLGTCD